MIRQQVRIRRRPGRRAAIAPLCLVWLVVVCALPAPGLAGTPGSESGAFADIAIGARALGMGGVGASLADGVWATYWNPANLFHLQQTELAVDYVDLFGLDIARHTSIAFVRRHEPTRNTMRGKRVVEVPREDSIFGWGLSLGITTVDLEPETYNEIAPGISLAAQPWSGIAVGSTFRLLRAGATIDDTDVSAIGYALDLGFAFDRLPDIRAVAMARNLLSAVSWHDHVTDQLPIDLTLGLSYTGWAPVTLAVESAMATDNAPLRELRGGGEWSHASSLLQVRGGAIWREDRDVDQLGLTFGVGAGLREVHADYAFVSQGETFGDNHRISLGMRF